MEEDFYVQRRENGANGLGTAEVGHLKTVSSKYSTKADRGKLVDILPSAPILTIPC